MVHFSRLLQLKLSLSLCLNFWIVLCSGCGMYVWPVMSVCVDYFVSISYAIIGLENQVVFSYF